MLTADIILVMQLYRRCKRWNTLPMPGGIMAQDERLMSYLDVIEGELERIRAKRMDDQRNDAMKDQMVSELRSGRA